MKSFRSFPSLILFLLLCLSLACSTMACSSAPVRPDTPEGSTQVSVMAAARAWQGDALHLPARSPLVLQVDLEELLATGSDALNWVSAEPQMFGPNGVMIVGMLLSLWQENIAKLGQDPFSASFWSQMGLDVERPLYLGLYPTQGTEAGRFVEVVEGQVREHLGANDEDDLLEALQEALSEGDPLKWRGLSAQVLRSVEDMRPLKGMRMVIPVANAQLFSRTFEGIIAADGYEGLDETTEPLLEEGQRVFMKDFGRAMAVMLRLSGDVAIIDMVDREFQPRATGFGDEDQVRERMLGDLVKAVALFESGYPAAPRPLDAPFVSLSIEQARVAEFVKLRGYVYALESMRTQSSEQRDRHFIGSVYYPLLGAKSWASASATLPGTAYGVHRRCSWLEGSGCIFGLEMTLFGDEGLPVLDDSRVEPGLDVAQRGLGLSLGPELFLDPRWEQWFGEEESQFLLDALDTREFEREKLHILSPLTTAPRSLALFYGKLRAILLEEENEEDRLESEAILAAMKAVQRIEIGSVGLDTSRVGWQSRFVFALIFEPGSALEDQELLVEVLQELVVELTLEALAEQGEEVSILERVRTELRAPLVQNSLAELVVPPATPLRSPFYVFDTQAQTPYFFVSSGLGGEEAQEEFMKLLGGQGSGSRVSDTLYLRVEPMALLAVVMAWRPYVLDPIDLNVLVQRLGPMIFSIRPYQQEGMGAIRYLFELQNPPKL